MLANGTLERQERGDIVDAPVKKALIFTMEGNADGEAALAFFQARGVAVDVRDVGKDPQASLELFGRAGRLAVPTVVIDERVFDGFATHREEIEALLRD
jgi:glutaredoxin